MVNPVPGHRITTPYGRAGNWSGGKHGGADWAAPTGTPVVAAWSGTVTDRTWGSAYGNHIVVNQDRLPDGSPGLWGLYAHLSQVLVRPGQRIAAGQRIGLVGSTGNSTGPHLHYEVQGGAGWKSGNHVNPAPWVSATTTGAPAPQPGKDTDMTPEQAKTLGEIKWAVEQIRGTDLPRIRNQTDTLAGNRVAEIRWGVLDDVQGLRRMVANVQAQLRRIEEQLGVPPSAAVDFEQDAGHRRAASG